MLKVCLLIIGTAVVVGNILKIIGLVNFSKPYNFALNVLLLTIFIIMYFLNKKENSNQN